MRALIKSGLRRMASSYCFDRLICLAVLVKGIGKIIKSQRVLRIQLNRPLKLSHRFTLIACFEQDNAKIIMGLRKIRVKPNRLVIIINGFVEVPFPSENCAEIIIRHPARWIFGKRVLP